MSFNVLDHFEGLRKLSGNNQYICKCPSHDDRSASLTIKLIEDKVLVHCFAGCIADDIVSSVGLTINDLFDEKIGSNVIQKSKIKKSGNNKFKEDFLYVFVAR